MINELPTPEEYQRDMAESAALFQQILAICRDNRNLVVLNALTSALVNFVLEQGLPEELVIENLENTFSKIQEMRNGISSKGREIKN